MEVILESYRDNIIAFDSEGNRFSVQARPENFLDSQLYSGVWDAEIIDSTENVVGLIGPKFSEGVNLGWWIEKIIGDNVHLRHTFLNISYYRHGSLKRGWVETTGFSVQTEERIFDILSDDLSQLFGRIINQKEFFEEIQRVLGDKIDNFERKFNGFVDEFPWLYEGYLNFGNTELDERFEHCQIEKGNWYLCETVRVPYSVPGSLSESHLVVRIIRRMIDEEIAREEVLSSTDHRFYGWKVWSNGAVTSPEEPPFLGEEFVSLQDKWVDYGRIRLTSKVNGQKLISGEGINEAISHAKKIKENKARISYLLSLPAIVEKINKKNTFLLIKDDSLFKELLARHSWSNRRDCYKLKSDPLRELDSFGEGDIFFLNIINNYSSYDDGMEKYRIFPQKTKVLLENALMGFFPENTIVFPNGLRVFRDPDIKKISSSDKIFFFFEKNIWLCEGSINDLLIIYGGNLARLNSIAEESFKSAGEDGREVSPGWEEASRQCKKFFFFDEEKDFWARAFYASSTSYGGYDEPRWDGDVGG